MAIENNGPVSLIIAEANLLESSCFWRLLRSRQFLMNGYKLFYGKKKIKKLLLLPDKNSVNPLVCEGVNK